MTFTNPHVSITNMAQWVDSADKTSCDQNKLVEYLYHISLCNARHKNFFNDEDTYDDFCLFCVSKLLTRLNNKQATPVKSIVNYLKHSLDPWYAEYVRCFCSGSPDINMYSFDVSDFADYLIDDCSELDYRSYDKGFLNLSAAIRNHILKLPRKRYSSEWSNIYLSCLLTLKDRIDTAISLCKTALISEEPQLMSSIIRSLKTRPPILFHIDECWSNYIVVIVNELIHVISTELTYMVHVSVTPASCLRNMVIAANNEEENN